MAFLPVDVLVNQKAKEKHQIDTLNLLAYIDLLILLVITIWILKKRRICLHETGLAIIYGMIMGATIRYVGLTIPVQSGNYSSKIPLDSPPDYALIETAINGELNNTRHLYAYEFKGELQKNAKLGTQITYASIDPEVFFNIILPPIVLNAGLSLKRRHFFRNIGAIFAYAFVGTALSVGLVGYVIYGTLHLLKYFGQAAHLAELFTLTNCLQFGAIISPTDPLAVLAIFQELGVDVNLYALVFGESILNDAVSIVLTQSIDQFSIAYGSKTSIQISILATIWECFLSFTKTFLSSCLIGIAIGILASLTTKFTRLAEFPLLETTLLVLMSYLSFLTAEAIDASGIVAILSCGVTQAHYTINNLSFDARDRITKLFELLTFLCENFLFLAVGVAIWQRNQSWDLVFICIASIAVIIARALSVYPLSVLLNFGRRNKIPLSFQHVIAWGGGARGVISYSLAARNTVGRARQIILSTTTVIVIFSVISVGSSVEKMLKMLAIPFRHSHSEEQCSSSSNNNNNDDHHHHHRHYNNNKRNESASFVDDNYSIGGTAVSSAPGWYLRSNKTTTNISTTTSHNQNINNHISNNSNINNTHASVQTPSTAIAVEANELTTGEEELLASSSLSEEEESPYENAGIVRRWRYIDNNFIKPFLTNSQPTLIETLPASLVGLAKLLTSEEQLSCSRQQL